LYKQGVEAEEVVEVAKVVRDADKALELEREEVRHTTPNHTTPH
jgi:hypothetical protein